MMHRIIGAAGSVLAAALMAACGGAVSAPTAQEPTPDTSTPAERLLGSWQNSHYEIDSGGRRELNKFVLTLTPDRFIHYEIEYDHESNYESSSYYTGEWKATEDTITLTVRWFDDGELSSYDRSYSIEDGDLVVEMWRDRDAALGGSGESAVERYTRHPGAGDIRGAWLAGRRVNVRNEFVGTQRIRITITDSHFRETISTVPDQDGRDEQRFELSGSLEHDPVRGYLHVTVTDVSFTSGGADMTDQVRSRYVGHALRIAYVATPEPNRIAISEIPDEMVYSEEVGAWVDRELPRPWGRYELLALRE